MKKTLIQLVCLAMSFLFATAQSPTFEWAKKTGGVGHEWCFSVTTDLASSVYATGSFANSVDFDPGAGNYTLTCGTLNQDAYVSKLDSSGNFIWARQFKGTGILGARGKSIKVDNFGNVFITGNFQETVDFDPGPGTFNLTTGSGQGDIFMVKLDIAGNFIWAKQFKSSGISGNATGESLVVDNSGNVILTGNFTETVDFDPGTGVYSLVNFGLSDIFVTKLNSAGNLIWAKQIGGTGGDDSRSIALDGSGNILLTGNFQATADFDPGPGLYNLTSISSNGDEFVCKLDASGNLIWVKVTTSYKSNAIAIDSYDNVVTVGEFGGTVDFDPGAGVYNLSAPNMGVFVKRLDKNGIFINAQAMTLGPIGPNYAFYLNALDIDAAGSVYLAGGFVGEADFDPGPGTYYVSSPYRPLPYICKLTNSGDLVWTSIQYVDNYAYNFSIHLDTSRNIYAAGTFEFNLVFNPGPNQVLLTTAGYQDFFISKMSQCQNNSFSTITGSACNSYNLNGHTYTASGVYTQIINNASGCDSVITLNLTINGSNTTSSFSACDTYSWQGNVYTVSGIYSDTLISSTGCDSILNLNLTINHKIFTSINTAICQGQNYAGHTATGIYIDTYIGTNGCDSIRTLSLTVNPKSISTINYTMCQGETYSGHTTTGVYIDTLIAANGCDSIRTLQLIVNPKAFTTINSSICQGQSYFAGGANQILSGIYKDTLLTSLGCDSVITTNLTVTANLKPNLGPDRNLCLNAPLSITPGIFPKYLWQDNSTQPNFMISNKGTYWVKVTDANNCSATDTLKVLAIDTLPKNFLPTNQLLCYNSVFNISVLGYKNYLWSTSETTNAVSLNTFGTFYLTVTDNNNCVGKDTIVLLRNYNCIPVSIPNAFTPNKDGTNDNFKPIITQEVSSYNFTILNRYGQKIFTTNNYGIGWDGTLKGVAQPRNSYVYLVSFKNNNGELTEYKGTVTLIR
jgi:gliding motility-associated-like protein